MYYKTIGNGSVHIDDASDDDDDDDENAKKRYENAKGRE